MFRKILVANRGEIAVRIMRTCRTLGIPTVAIYSEADRMALHCLTATQSICIGPAPPEESYLCAHKIIDAAVSTGADAIHPGYGFLSEKAMFAQACRDAGLTWIGPSPENIAQFGDKILSHRLMQQHGLPTIPVTELMADAPHQWQQQADKLGYPIAIKAAAGSGGKGIYIARSAAQIGALCRIAIGEATATFGDPRIYLERYIANPRHIEFQIIADHYGNVIHLFERECSIQRRHQKIIEETPCTIISQDLREDMAQAAITAARAAQYTNAGTIEFLFDADTGRYYFLEANTRIQVEHPITEATTGLDLIQLQIAIAAGLPLPFTQRDITQIGHAIECRICAEDPARDFAPSPGTITAMHTPSGPGVRCDTGVYPGYSVPIYYDPLLAKLIAHGHNREMARLRMIDALRQFAILGIQTNIPLLIEIFEHPAFQRAELSTNFLVTHLNSWQAQDAKPEIAAIATILEQILPTMTNAAGQATANTNAHIAPWQALGAWRIDKYHKS